MITPCARSHLALDHTLRFLRLITPRAPPYLLGLGCACSDSESKPWSAFSSKVRDARSKGLPASAYLRMLNHPRQPSQFWGGQHASTPCCWSNQDGSNTQESPQGVRFRGAIKNTCPTGQAQNASQATRHAGCWTAATAASAYLPVSAHLRMQGQWLDCS